MAAIFCDFGSSVADDELEDAGFTERIRTCAQARGETVVSLTGRVCLLFLASEKASSGRRNARFLRPEMSAGR